MNVLAVIPARGGSKGITRKNLVEIHGAPLVVHSIRHAIAAERVTRVVVSTDDGEIGDVSRRAGAEVPFLRPPELAGDEVLDLPVFKHVLEMLAARESYVPDLVVHLRPTAPHRKPGWVDQAVKLLAERRDADSVRSVSRPHQHPYRVFRKDEQGFLVPVMKQEHPKPYELRRQDLPEMFYYNCVVDVTRPRTICRKNSMTGERIWPLVLEADDVIDIDTPRDLQVARMLMEAQT
jgi:N-acylneuraminate cytidylyltransferase